VRVPETLLSGEEECACLFFQLNSKQKMMTFFQYDAKEAPEEGQNGKFCRKSGRADERDSEWNGRAGSNRRTTPSRNQKSDCTLFSQVDSSSPGSRIGYNE